MYNLFYTIYVQIFIINLISSLEFFFSFIIDKMCKNTHIFIKSRQRIISHLRIFLEDYTLSSIYRDEVLCF